MSDLPPLPLPYALKCKLEGQMYNLGNDPNPQPLWSQGYCVCNIKTKDEKGLRKKKSLLSSSVARGR